MKKRRIAGLLVSMTAAVVLLTSCGNSKIPLSFDDQIKEDGTFNQSLFYRNDLVTPVPDPEVIQITDPGSPEYGWYYLYGTNSTTSFICYRSKDLTSWENVSEQKGFPMFYPPEDNFCYDTLWAPEVIYDEDEGKYYLFYSGNNRYTQEVDPWSVMIGVAVSDQPYGPFVPYEDAAHSAKTPLFDSEKALEAARRTLPDAGPLWTPIRLSPPTARNTSTSPPTAPGTIKRRRCGASK